MISGQSQLNPVHIFVSYFYNILFSFIYVLVSQIASYIQIFLVKSHTNFPSPLHVLLCPARLILRHLIISAWKGFIHIPLYFYDVKMYAGRLILYNK
jgi:hypothetical protein